MIQNMAKSVEENSEWYIISMDWINKWQKHVGFDDTEANKGPKPGKIDNSDIIVDYYHNDKGSYSTSLLEQSKSIQYQNYQMKSGLEEGTDYMLVDKNIYEFWDAKYGSAENQLKRFGVLDDTDETKVEMYLKVFNIYAVPNNLFKLYNAKKANESLTIPIYLSKCATLAELKKKIQRVLSSHLYFTLKNKSVMVTDLRLWKNNCEDVSKILEIDKKYTNYTSVTIEGELLNKEKADESKKLYEFNISDTDILIVETPKAK